MHTELSLDANEALSLASMVRQSCPTARLRGATRIQNRKLWREYGRRPFCLRLASMARSKGCACGCSYVHCRETHVRLTSDGGEANEMLLFHGTGATKPQARAELRGARGHRLQRERRLQQRTAGEANVRDAGASFVGSSAAGSAARVPATASVMQLVEQLCSGAAATKADAALLLAEQSSK
jgi:hypothetical protein